MKIVFFGSSGFSASILQKLIASNWQVSLVVTIPAGKKGRGQKLSESQVELLARKAFIPVMTPEKLKDNDVLAKLKSECADCLVVASYGKMLPTELLNACAHPLNVHPSLLPKYRGASPIISQLLDGIRESGTTIARVTEKLDAGGIVAQKKVLLTEDDSLISAEKKLMAASGELLLEVLQTIKNNTYRLIPQDESKASYVSKLDKEMGKIDWSQSASYIHNQIRAFVSWPTAYTYLKGRRVKLLQSKVESHTKNSVNSNPGVVYDIKKTGSALISCGTGALELIQIQPESGKPMTPYSYSVGNQLSTGDCFE